MFWKIRRFWWIGGAFVFLILAAILWKASGIGADETAGDLVRVDASPEQGFHWPYYLSIPPDVDEFTPGEIRPLLVLPNNTGRPSDDLEIHDEAARGKATSSRYVNLAQDLGAALLVPVFPRPESDWHIYTHALDRNTLITEIPDLERLDRQLIAMIVDAQERLAGQGMPVADRVLLVGFSASGMFANRFTMLHPERVRAAAVGSPGGWPMAPVATWEERPLPYPVGVADLATLTGEPFDLEAYRQVPHFFFLGDQDDNDGFDMKDKPLIVDLFGDTPVARWPVAKEIYRSVGADATFRLYSGVGHETTADISTEVLQFFREVLR